MMRIPKVPIPPPLSAEQIAVLTELVFLPECRPCRSDLIFVFGNGHPHLVQTVFRLYERSIAETLVISGGMHADGKRPEYWKHGDVSEAVGIAAELAELGVPEARMVLEDKSRNSSENVIFSKEIFDFSAVSSIIFVGKSHAAGRQYRTLKKHLPQSIEISHATYDMPLPPGGTINRNDWSSSDNCRSE